MQGIEKKKKKGFPGVNSFNSELVKDAVISSMDFMYVTCHRALRRKDTSADSEFAA